MEEYERELLEMKERVNRRPLLIEQEIQVRHCFVNSLYEFYSSCVIYTSRKRKFMVDIYVRATRVLGNIQDTVKKCLIKRKHFFDGVPLKGYVAS